MFTKKKWLQAFISTAVLTMAAAPSYAGFMGTTIHGEYLFPDNGTTFMDLGDAMVGAGAEFSISFDSTITVDFSDSTIAIDIAGGSTPFTAAAFNGFHFSDTSGLADAITQVSLVTTHNFAFDASGISFDANNIFLNFQGLDVVPDSSLLLAVNFDGDTPSLAINSGGGTPVPAPGTFALVSLGVAGLRRIRRSSKTNKVRSKQTALTTVLAL